jgi:uncharacterized protein (DUF58 family)
MQMVDEQAQRKHYFDPTVISQLKGLTVRARRVVEGVMLGMHKSPFRGISSEFAQHRNYVPGDDLRHLDWKVFARCDRFYIKQYQQETNLTCHFVLDCSESMNYAGAAPLTKFDYAATLVASFAHLIISQQDTVGLTLFAEKVRTTLPAKSTFGHLSNMVMTLENVTAAGLTRVGGSLGPVAGLLKRRSLVVLVSDFLDDTEPFAYGMNRLRFDGHDVIVLHLVDPWEKEFPFSGPSILEGHEKSGRLVCDPRDLREIYLEERANHVEEIKALCRGMHYDYQEIVTNEPLDEALATLLHARDALTGHQRRTAFA